MCVYDVSLRAQRRREIIFFFRSPSGEVVDTLFERFVSIRVYYPKLNLCSFSSFLGKTSSFFIIHVMLYKDTHHLFTREFKEEEDKDKG